MVALSDEPDNLNPIFGDLYGSIYGDHWPIFSSLLDYNQQLELEPDLASAVPEISADGKTVTVALREGVRWHDGRPFTAADVVFTYRAFLDPAVATPLRDELYNSLESVQAVDDRTVRFQLARIDPAILDKLTLGIVPEHVQTGQDLNTAAFNKDPIGTGPFVFDELRPGERMVLTPNPNYHGGQVGIPRLIFSFVPDENARASRLTAGQLDVDAVGLPPRVADQVAASNERLELVRIPGESTLLHLPHQNPLFADPAVRTAVNLAVDREAIVAGVFAGAGEATVSPIPDGHWADSGVEVPARDVPAARAALDAAGWVPGAGQVILDDDPIHRAGLRLHREIRQRVALLWQSLRIAADPRLTLAQLVTEPLRSGGRRHRPPAPDIAAALAARCEQVGLNRELWQRYPHEVSEGQLQRACLARALIQPPRYLICDEPTSMLDVSTQAALLAVIANEQRQRDLGTLLITHDRTLATHWCDRLIELTSQPVGDTIGPPCGASGTAYRPTG